jgi:hypothetical protein
VSLRLGRGWVVGLTVCSVLSAGIGFWIGVRGATVAPPAPAAVCPMIRPDIIDVLVPGHGKPVDESFSDSEAPWMRGTACVVNGSSAKLDISVMRYGRAAGRDPVQTAHQGMLRFLNRKAYPVELGDEAWYHLEYQNQKLRDIYLMSRVGNLVVQVYYETESVTEEFLVRSATVAAREVLSRL